MHYLFRSASQQSCLRLSYCMIPAWAIPYCMIALAIAMQNDFLERLRHTPDPNSAFGSLDTIGIVLRLCLPQRSLAYSWD